jgi:hypothetical protein
MVVVQTFAYLRNYPMDLPRVKLLVCLLWHVHSSCSCSVLGRLCLVRTISCSLRVLTLTRDRLLDFCHTIFVGKSLWIYLVAHFGDEAEADYIPWQVLD